MLDPNEDFVEKCLRGSHDLFHASSMAEVLTMMGLPMYIDSFSKLRIRRLHSLKQYGEEELLKWGMTEPSHIRIFLEAIQYMTEA